MVHQRAGRDTARGPNKLTLAQKCRVLGVEHCQLGQLIFVARGEALDGWFVVVLRAQMVAAHLVHEVLAHTRKARMLMDC